MACFIVWKVGCDGSTINVDTQLRVFSYEWGDPADRARALSLATDFAKAQYDYSKSKGQAYRYIVEEYRTGAYRLVAEYKD